MPNTNFADPEEVTVETAVEDSGAASEVEDQMAVKGAKLKQLIAMIEDMDPIVLDRIMQLVNLDPDIVDKLSDAASPTPEPEPGGMGEEELPEEGGGFEEEEVVEEDLDEEPEPEPEEEFEDIEEDEEEEASMNKEEKQAFEELRRSNRALCTKMLSLEQNQTKFEAAADRKREAKERDAIRKQVVYFQAQGKLPGGTDGHVEHFHTTFSAEGREKVFADLHQGPAIYTDPIFRASDATDTASVAFADSERELIAAFGEDFFFGVSPEQKSEILAKHMNDLAQGVQST